MNKVEKIPYAPPTQVRVAEVTKCGEFYAVEVNGPWLMAFDPERVRNISVGEFLVIWPDREVSPQNRRDAVVKLAISAIEAWASLEKEKRPELEVIWKELKKLGAVEW